MKMADRVADWIAGFRDIPVENIRPFVEAGARLVSVALIFLIASVLNTIVYRLIMAATRRRLRSERHKLNDPRRIQTSATILRSVSKYLIYFVASLVSLEALGLDATSLLAGAGFTGLIFGFGAQALIKDIISGFFLLFEDQYAVGDFVKVEGCEGLVEEIQLRVTKIRDFGGELHIIPNGNISKVTNYRSDGLRIWIAVTFDLREDLEKVIAALQDALDAAKPGLDGLIAGPTVLGVEEVNELGARIRIWARGVPMKHWNIARELNKLIKKTCDERGIKFASPHRTVQIQMQSPLLPEEGKDNA